MTFSRSLIRNNYIAQNEALARGAAINCEDSHPEIVSNWFESNRSYNGDGAAIYVVVRDSTTRDSSILIQNNVFKGNRAAAHGGAISLGDFSHANVFNNLFYQNISDVPEGGGGLFQEFYASPLIYNNIFVQNQGNAMHCLETDSLTTFNNCFYLNTPFDLSPTSCNIGTGNVFGIAPQFVNEAADNFRLASSSPLVNAGNFLPYWSDYQDYDGSSRFAGAAPDTGPFENCLIVPDISWNPVQPCIGEILNFDVLTTGYWEVSYWDYGDGTTDTFYYYEEIPPSKTYNVSGDLTITVTFMCPSDTQSVSKPITVITRPSGSFVTNDTTLCINQTIDFTNTTLGVNVTHDWQFGDGGVSTEINPSHQYLALGNYPVRLVSTNVCGSDTATLTINVIDAPNASISALPAFGSAPLPVTFSGSADNLATAWDWQFGDGGTSTLQNPSHVYEQPGIYTVQLTASNDCGAGLTDVNAGYIKVSGFELKLLSVDSLTNPLQRIYTLTTDSVFGDYANGINLSASLAPAIPRRGTATVLLSKSQVIVREAFTATVTMSFDLAQGPYDLQIIAVSVSNSPRDTVLTRFYAKPRAIAEVTPASLDFGQVEEDETKTDTIYVHNSLVVPADPVLTIAVFEVLSDNPKVTPQSTTSGLIQPGATFKIPVLFDPNGLGIDAGRITIRTNDPVQEFFEIDVTAEAIPERKPPKVTATAPGNDLDKVLIGTIITIDASEPLADSTLDVGRIQARALIRQQAIGGQFAASNNNTRIEFAPAAKLPPYDTIQVRLLATVRDLSGNALDGNGNNIAEGSPIDDYLFRFVTGPAVYPGDCNNDGEVNEVDIIPLGVFYGLEGPARNLMGEGNSWAPKQALEWEDPRATYADANGDGTIDESDLLVIAQNWSSSHQQRSAPTLPGDLDLAQFAENYQRLREALRSFEGSESGNRMVAVAAGLAGGVPLPSEFVLLQNYPNPFNPQTVISYAIPEGCNVRLTVHNILGQTVRILADAYEEPGFRSVTWDGTDQAGRYVSSGVYFYRLEAGSFSEIRKMLKLQ